MKKVIIVLAVLLSMVGVAQAGDKPSVIRVGYVGNAFGKSYASGAAGALDALSLLEEEFKNDGIKFEKTYYKATGPGLNEAFSAGLLDFGSYGDLPAVVGKAGGLKTKFVLSSGVGNNIYILVPPESNISSIKELKGKKVAVTKGTYLHLTLNRLLDANGLTEKDVRLVNLSIADAQAALASKGVDAFVSTPDRPLVDQGLAKSIYDTRKDPLKWRGRGGVVVTEEFASKYPDITRRVVKCYLKASYWSSQEKNKEAFIQLALKTGATYKYTKEDYEGQLLKDRVSPVIDDATVNAFKEIVEFSYQRGLIRKKYDVDEWIDKSYSEAALKELGLEKFWAK
ncbi:MAG: ABC transporter substrate-binding protein [Chlorobiales bacterium]|jgi:sulfonate transport system substrate-binding protein|nr:ABC transporter substrate-binding protein [Chlorobiales bacterium]